MLDAAPGAAPAPGDGMPDGMPDARQDWMSVLAKALPHEIEDVFADLGETPIYAFLRRPETGMVMIRGRAGGTGERFNMGEMTVTRCVVQAEDGAVGHGYVAGRNTRHAELAALFDAMLQDEDRREGLLRRVVEPLRAAQAARRRTASAKAAATRVDFFTMVRGED